MKNICYQNNRNSKFLQIFAKVIAILVEEKKNKNNSSFGVKKDNKCA